MGAPLSYIIIGAACVIFSLVLAGYCVWKRASEEREREVFNSFVMRQINGQLSDTHELALI